MITARRFVFVLAMLTWSGIAVAETRYVVTMHVLKANGDYSKFQHAGTKQGVSLVECEMRKDAWKAEQAGAIASALQTLREQGLHGDVRFTCEPLAQ